MTGRELFTTWSGRDELWPRQSPADQRAWDRLAAWMYAEKIEAVSKVVARREGSS